MAMAQRSVIWITCLHADPCHSSCFPFYVCVLGIFRVSGRYLAVTRGCGVFTRSVVLPVHALAAQRARSSPPLPAFSCSGIAKRMVYACGAPQLETRRHIAV